MSSSEGKKYYCSIKAEFGRVLEDGSYSPKNPMGSEWLDLDYAEAVTFQAMVLAPAVEELKNDTLRMGITKAVADGVMDERTAQILLNTIDKQPDKGRR